MEKNHAHGRLVLKRKVAESVTLKTTDGEITVRVSRIFQNETALLFVAPKSVAIIRTELEERQTSLPFRRPTQRMSH